MALTPLLSSLSTKNHHDWLTSRLMPLRWKESKRQSSALAMHTINFSSYTWISTSSRTARPASWKNRRPPSPLQSTNPTCTNCQTLSTPRATTNLRCSLAWCQTRRKIIRISWPTTARQERSLWRQTQRSTQVEPSTLRSLWRSQTRKVSSTLTIPQFRSTVWSNTTIFRHCCKRLTLKRRLSARFLTRGRRLCSQLELPLLSVPSTLFAIVSRGGNGRLRRKRRASTGFRNENIAHTWQTILTDDWMAQNRSD